MVANAVKEGVYNNEFPSGKYKLGGDWVLTTSSLILRPSSKSFHLWAVL